ncbi:hypothetical protein BDZ45DRAFT_777624 [Acephala macrosclerotiorum]|nr:hypothetical protein BDZ45DRAFT_777624 [Acephala macrosclerotiorum]
MVTSLLNNGAVPRAVGAFKALRALKLLNAAFVSLSLLVPFAMYGVNPFNGQMLICNDNTGDIANLLDCFGEWASTPFSNNWPLLAPRVVSNPYYNFDDFGSSLFILFQIVSQKSWVDVMWSAKSITGRGLQPAYYASQGNALFFVIFNLLGTVFMLTLFISVFIRSYTEQTGVAFLTLDQRAELELRKLLRQVSPSKRPSPTDGKKWKDWCYKKAVRKHGKWQQAVTVVLVLHLILFLWDIRFDSTAFDQLQLPNGDPALQAFLGLDPPSPDPTKRCTG